MLSNYRRKFGQPSGTLADALQICFLSRLLWQAFASQQL